MPYQPYDTGWITSVYGGICLTWFLYSRGCLPHVTSVLCYNNIFIPFIELLNKFCELIGNSIITIGSGIIRCESAIFKRFNYINPIFTTIDGIESLFSRIDIDIGTPTTQYAPSNVRRRKSSTGKHLCSYYARKRLHRQQHVISGSNQSKNDNSHNTSTNVPPSSHSTETYYDDFYPMDDPSCCNRTWYDAICPYWTGGMIWDGAYVLNHQILIQFLFLICLLHYNFLLQFKHRKQGVRARMSAHGPPLLMIVDLVFTSSRMPSS
jgi:hypothetical protein